MKVAFICEDHTNDQYIVKPLLEALMKALGKPRANVSPVTSPRLTGFDSLLRELCGMVKRYGRVASAVVVAFDLDGEDGQEGRPDKSAKVRYALEQCQGRPDNVFLLPVRQELEVAALWGARGTLAATWTEIRAEPHPKERFFDPLLERSDALSPDGGRTRLVEQSLSRDGDPSARGSRNLRTSAPLSKNT